ncbi:MAG: hypothetical protein V7607_5019 [Solirubrobacteraceae bacterium]
MAESSALEGIKVIDVATLFAAPSAATLLGDYGAEVIKIEHPRGDPVRQHGPSVDGVNLWWKSLARNKRVVELYLGSPEGRDALLALVDDADVLIENFRPGTLERWGLGWEVLSQRNPRLVLARVTGFGQQGPMSHRAGFGTLAEAMSGFASVTGQPDGPPTLPPFGLADGIAGIMTAYAIMVALSARERIGRGQVIDVALIEPIMAVLGPQITEYEALGTIQPRLGNRSAHTAPRNTYRTRDRRWLAVSTSSHSVAERVMRLVGRSDVVEEPWFATGAGRVEHADELDAAVAEWIAMRDADEVISAFEDAEAAVAPIYDASDIVDDPQYAALQTVVRMPDDELGEVAMLNVPFRLSETPGRIRWPGRPQDADTDEVLDRPRSAR